MKLFRVLIATMVAFIIPLSTLVAANAWTPPLNVSTFGLDASEPQVTIDAAGNAIAVWTDTDLASPTLSTRVYSSTAPFLGPWSAPVAISPDGISPDAANASTPQIGIDAAGNAIAVWSIDNGPNNFLQYATKPFGGPWSSATDLTSTAESAINPDLAVNASGQAVLAWQFDAPPSTIRASIFNGVSWSPAVDLSANTDGAFFPSVGIDAAGNAVVVWSQGDGTNSIIRASEFDGVTWSSPATDLSAAGQDAFSPQVAVNANGIAVAVWERSNGTNSIVQARTFNLGVWSAPIDISSLGSNSNTPSVAIDSNGNAAIVWTNSFTSIQAALLPLGAPSVTIQTLSSGVTANNPRVSMNASGVAFAVWELSTSTDNFIQSSILIGSTWTAPVNVQTSATENLTAPQVSVNLSNRAVAIWRISSEDLGSFIQASFYELTLNPLIPSPSNLRGFQCCNKFLTQTEFYNIIKWDPSFPAGAPIAWYLIYRAPNLVFPIAVIPANGPFKYIDHNRKKKVTYTYFILAVDTLNSTSAPAAISIIPLKHCHCDDCDSSSDS